jgi:hypothetical protein
MSPEEAKYANDFMRLFWSMESNVVFHSLLSAGSISGWCEGSIRC